MKTKNPFILWLFGVPGAGKTTYANMVNGYFDHNLEIIDSDDIRSRLTPLPNWSDSERKIVYNTIWEIALRFQRRGISSVIAASAGGVDLNEYRNIAPQNVFFVHLMCSLEDAAKRHPNFLFDKALKEKIAIPIVRRDAKGEIFPADIEFSKKTGISGYEIEIPTRLDLEVDTSNINLQDKNINKILDMICDRVS